MVATNMYGKSSYGGWIYGITRKYDLLSFLFTFLIITFDNFCYTFTLCHFSAISWDLILRLICLDMFVIFLFVSVIMLFVYEKLLLYTDSSCCLCSGGFVWDVVTVPDPPLLLYFSSVNNNMVFSELSFS